MGIFDFLKKKDESKALTESKVPSDYISEGNIKVSHEKKLDLKPYYSIDSRGRYEHISECTLILKDSSHYVVSVSIAWNAGGRADVEGGTVGLCDVSDVEEKGISYLYDKLQHLKVGTNTQFHLTEAEFVQLFMSSFRVDELLDDITFIREMKHMTNGSWHQFDILFDSQIYGWEFMVKWAEYMGSVDLENISEVTIGELIGIRDITKQYHENGHKFAGLEAAAEERGMLSIAGLSKTLRAPVKIMWFNQTRVIRFFTLEDDETLMKKYAETVARWSFETENAMKLGKPILS